MKRLLLFFMIFLLTGCSAVYNLDISNDTFNEKLIIRAATVVENSTILEYAYPIYFDGEINPNNPFDKISNEKYYDSKLVKSDLNQLSYSARFSVDDFKKSNILYNSFDNIVFRRYDHDEDGKDDYMLFSTTDTFTWFNLYDNLDDVIVNITCHYDIISSNADTVNGHVLTWHFTKNNTKPINFVYNPDKPVDLRTLWDRIRDGEFVNMFTISLVLLIISSVIWFLLKKKGDIKNKI